MKIATQEMEYKVELFNKCAPALFPPRSDLVSAANVLMLLRLHFSIHTLAPAQDGELVL